MLLAGDVGGTKAVLALAGREGKIAREETFQCAKFPSFDAIVDAFLAHGAVNLAGACFGVAGPVLAGRAKITNLPWIADQASIAKRAETRGRPSAE